MSMEKTARKHHLLLATTFILLLAICACEPKPKIVIDTISDYGVEDGFVAGSVKNVEPEDYVLQCFIKVDGVYWTKPTYDNPMTSLDQPGRFTIDFTTGGSDACAEEVCLFLVPAGSDAVICDPCEEFPEVPDQVTVICEDRTPPVREISFAGCDWTVKRGDCPIGPGPNYFGDTEENVYVDSSGYLHLTVRNVDDRWFCSEVINKTARGYGLYRLELKGRVDELDPNEVFGFFTWDTDAREVSFRELDFEIARWGDALNPTNAQFVVQPCSACPGCGDKCTRFNFTQADENSVLTIYLRWENGQFEGRAYSGSYPDDSEPPDNALMYKWVYGNSDIPEPGNEQIRLNLWLHEGLAPTDGLDREVVVTDYSWNADIPAWWEQEDEPGIYIDRVSPYGTVNGYVWGHAENVDYSQYAVLVAIKVAAGWWVKPYADTPLTTIESGGTWRCDITTGGVDEEATDICAYLVPAGYNPPQILGLANLPTELDQFPEACVERIH